MFHGIYSMTSCDLLSLSEKIIGSQCIDHPQAYGPCEDFVTYSECRNDTCQCNYGYYALPNNTICTNRKSRTSLGSSLSPHFMGRVWQNRSSKACISNYIPHIVRCRYLCLPLIQLVVYKSSLICIDAYIYEIYINNRVYSRSLKTRCTANRPTFQTPQCIVPTVHNLGTEMCTDVHISITKWGMVEYGSGALWDLYSNPILSIVLSHYQDFIVYRVKPHYALLSHTTLQWQLLDMDENSTGPLFT